MNSLCTGAEMRDFLRTHNFQSLFTQCLGWDNHSNTQNIALAGRSFRFDAIATKGGLPVFVCRVENLAALERKTALDLDNALAKVAAEHIIVFHDQSSQLWQFSKREIGKANRFNRTAPLPNSHSFTDLIARLSGLQISLEDEIAAQERNGFGIIEIAGRINRNFDVDKVSADFYKGFKTQRDALLSFLTGLEGRVKDEYASLLLTRLMFLYFMQSKRFLVGDTGYLRNSFEDKSARFGGSDYYSGFLCPLFFEMLSQKPVDRFAKDTAKLREAHRVFGDLIYLNGGLFAARDFENPKKIAVKDEFFEGLFGFFDRWNWVLDDRPTRDGREINPDVLGYVFEKFINQKQMGAYYTKEDITGYIARNTILPFLWEKSNLNAERAFGLIRANPSRYIYPSVKHGCELLLPPTIEEGIKDVSKRANWNKTATPELGLPTEIWREVVARRARFEALTGSGLGITSVADLITHNLNIELWMADVVANLETEDEVWALWRALEEVTILDPTVGSGAFLFAAMNILEPIYRELLARMDEVVEFFDERRARNPHLLVGRIEEFRATLDDIEKHANRTYEIFKKMMVQNLYGVDIMGEAVEICKLRLFLKLAAQAHPDETQKNLGIEPLPDIDFNIRAGNTLVGFATEGEAESAAATQLSYGIEWSEVAAEMKKYGHAFDQFHEAQKRDGWVTASVKAALQTQHDTLVEKLNLFNAGQYAQMPKSDPKGYAAWKASHQPFHWCAEFYSVIQSGGFDVIIGNPPYVEYSKVKSDYTIRGYETLSCGNLYANIFERCLQIAASDRHWGVILPLSSVCTARMTPFVKKVSNTKGEKWVAQFGWRPSKLFEGVNIPVTVLVGNATPDSQAIFSTSFTKWYTEKRPHVFELLRFISVRELMPFPQVIPKIGCEMEARIAAKIFKKHQKVSHYQQPSSGNNHVLYYRNTGGLYWRIFTDFRPRFLQNGVTGNSSTESTLAFRDKDTVSWVVGLLNSNLYWFYYVAYSSFHHVNPNDILDFPVSFDLMSKDTKNKLAETSTRLMDDMKIRSELRQRAHKGGNISDIQTFFPSRSKKIVDELDVVLAQYYNLSDEEVDYVINYDIQYRLNQNLEED